MTSEVCADRCSLSCFGNRGVSATESRLLPLRGRVRQSGAGRDHKSLRGDRKKRSMFLDNRKEDQPRALTGMSRDIQIYAQSNEAWAASEHARTATLPASPAWAAWATQASVRRGHS